MPKRLYKSDEVPRTNVSMTVADLLIIDKYKEIEKLPTRTLAVRKLVDLGIEYYNIKNALTKIQISKLTT